MLVCDNLAWPPSAAHSDATRGLQARMALTMFLLGLLYAVLVGALIAAHVSVAS